MLIILTLVLTNRVFAEARRRLPFLRVVLESSPTTIAHDGAWLTEAIAHEELDAQDLETSLREHGLASVDEVALAVLEPDGSISVVPRDRQRPTNRRRKVRIVTHR